MVHCVELMQEPQYYSRLYLVQFIQLSFIQKT